MHPSDIQALLINNQEIVRKYEDFMVRRVLLADPDSRWCPAPDCRYIIFTLPYINYQLIYIFIYVATL